jgi:hypothetical protein
MNTVSELTNELGLMDIRNRKWFIQVRGEKPQLFVFTQFFLLLQACSAPSGDGLYEGLDWLATALNAKK